MKNLDLTKLSAPYSWKKIHNWPRNFAFYRDVRKFKKQRIKQGYCQLDLYDFDMYLLRLLAESLTSFRNNADSENDKEIRKMIYHFREAQYCDDERNNIFREDINAYKKKELDISDDEYQRLVKNYEYEKMRLNRIKREHITAGFSLLSNYLEGMWF